jgi:hypothetical protein
MIVSVPHLISQLTECRSACRPRLETRPRTSAPNCQTDMKVVSVPKRRKRHRDQKRAALQSVPRLQRDPDISSVPNWENRDMKAASVPIGVLIRRDGARRIWLATRRREVCRNRNDVPKCKSAPRTWKPTRMSQACRDVEIDLSSRSVPMCRSDPEMRSVPHEIGIPQWRSVPQQVSDPS